MTKNYNEACMCKRYAVHNKWILELINHKFSEA